MTQTNAGMTLTMRAYGDDATVFQISNDADKYLLLVDFASCVKNRARVEDQSHADTSLTSLPKINAGYETTMLAISAPLEMTTGYRWLWT
jgi:hypothetical protein